MLKKKPRTVKIHVLPNKDRLELCSAYYHLTSVNTDGMSEVNGLHMLSGIHSIKEVLDRNVDEG